MGSIFNFEEKFDNILKRDTTKLLAIYLGKVLDKISHHWWEECVLEKLSAQQKENCTRRKLSSLEQLDLAALLKVFDQNWYHIATKENLVPDFRNVVREMLSIRHRWSHTSAALPSFDDNYRDLDTLRRFLLLIAPQHPIHQTLLELKEALLPLSRTEASIKDVPITKEVASKKIADALNAFSIGQEVYLISNPSSRGVVTAVTSIGGQNQYTVFMDGRKRTLFESQIRAVETVESFSKLSKIAFHHLLTSLQIKSPGASTLFSLHAARVDFIPYQYRPVLKFIKSDRPRLLIADGVGVGKTIEAGLILKELQARRDVRNILVLCPRPLITERKWEKELRRFDEKFVHLDGDDIRYCIDEMDKEGEWPEQYAKSILPFSLLDESMLEGSGNTKKNRKVGLYGLDAPPRFDLVIVDEAHYLRNPSTQRHKVVKFFCDNAEAVIFLTATPIQLKDNDLYELLKLLRPDLILDIQSFQHLTEPNPHINRAITASRKVGDNWKKEALQYLQAAAATPWGSSLLISNPDYKDAIKTLNSTTLTDIERVKLIGKLESLHTLSGIINRTRRRDIGKFTTRDPQTVTVDFTPAQKQLHDQVLQLQIEIFQNSHGDNHLAFMLSSLRRRTASCIFGLKPYLKDILTKNYPEEEEMMEDDGEWTWKETKGLDTLAGKIDQLLEWTDTIDELDPKFEALLKIVKEKQEMPNNRVMLFSSFRHTLFYLYKKLYALGIKSGLIHGGVSDDERRELRERFEQKRGLPDSLDVLLFSEVGSEGLDYQFCDCMVNYDLPWNPMRIEQRIGRIDRNGQQSEKVLIYNLITPGTIDADIYERCMLRIGVFRESIGDCEEILGKVTKQINEIAENYKLTPEQQRDRLQQLADNEINEYAEKEKLEEQQFNLFGIDIPQDLLRKELDDANSYWLSKPAILDLVYSYLQTLSDKGQLPIPGDKELKTLRLSQEARAKLRERFQQLPQHKNGNYKDWDNWLKGSEQYLQLTFDDNCAKENPKAAFINPLHPLVLQAAHAVSNEDKPFVCLKTFHESLPEGEYPFAIYQWQYVGLKNNMELKAIAVDPTVQQELMDMLINANEWVDNELDPENVATNELETVHYGLWEAEKLKHKQTTKQWTDFKKESLQTSHKARMALLEEQLQSNENNKIKAMRKGQLDTAKADYDRVLKQLEESENKADLLPNLVVFGVLKIENEKLEAE